MKSATTLAMLVAILAAGCAPDERMPLGDCDYGLYWADCGGNGDPVLGCDRETGECRWFSGDVTARGYAISTCPPTDPCCHSNWPFTDFSPDGHVREVTVEQLSLLGLGVTGRTPYNHVTVQIDFTEDPVGILEYCRGGMSCTTWGGGNAVQVGESIVIVYS